MHQEPSRLKSLLLANALLQSDKFKAYMLIILFVRFQIIRVCTVFVLVTMQINRILTSTLHSCQSRRGGTEGLCAVDGEQRNFFRRQAVEQARLFLGRKHKRVGLVWMDCDGGDGLYWCACTVWMDCARVNGL